MDSSNAEKIEQIMEKFHRYIMNKKMAGEIPRNEFKMLKMIKMNSSDDEGITISSLSELLAISKPAVSQMINGLEDKEYIERVFTRNDRRIVFVRLTQRGKQYLVKEYRSFLQRLTEVFDRMGEKDTEELLRLLEKLYQIVNEKNNK